MVLVGLQVRHPAVKDTIAHLVPKALDASVVPDGVRFVADLPARCPEAARGSLRLASVDAQEPQAAQPRQALLQLDALPMVASPLPARGVAPEFPSQAVEHVHQSEQRLLEPKMEAPAAQPAPRDESEPSQERSREARSELSPQVRPELPCLLAE
jgi:hypothetical protein